MATEADELPITIEDGCVVLQDTEYWCVESPHRRIPQDLHHAGSLQEQLWAPSAL